MKEKGESYWVFSIGLYPGILFGLRTYEEEHQRTHALYIPFVNFVLEVFYDELAEEKSRE